MTESPIDRIQKTEQMAEIWWDSSPLVFDDWRSTMVRDAAPERRSELDAQLARLMNAGDGSRHGFRGCTTNPPLSLAAVNADSDSWNARIDELASKNPEFEAQDLSWLVYKDVIHEGAMSFYDMWESSNSQYGYVSGQLDPRSFVETDIMVAQAREIAAISPNVMVKVPASKQGIDVLRVLTSEGIPTNVTTCFTVAQVMAAARATVEGLVIARERGVDTSSWRAVITLMLARLTERPVIDEQAAYAGIHLTAADKKWFGIAVFKRAYQLLREGGYPSKLLLCSVRPGPVVAGRSGFWDIEAVCGANIVYTLPPAALTPLFDLAETLDIRDDAIDDEVPMSSLSKFLQLPYGIQSYEPHGMSLDQFNSHPATLFTVEEFSTSALGLENYVAQRLSGRTAPATGIGQSS